MSKAVYSSDLCRGLIERIGNLALTVPYRRSRYESGDVLSLRFRTVWPERGGEGKFRVEKYVGGGFAGQVYRCTILESGFADGHVEEGLEQGRMCAVKIMRPWSRGTRRFRDFLYWLGFQSAFSAQVNEGACRAGLLWQRLAQRAMAAVMGKPCGVAAVYASFYDSELRSFGEIREWVEGRTWRLEPDTHWKLRKQWRTVVPESTGSPEFVAKRKFMSEFVAMLRAMGARELARQYEWWTMKSQPNALKRADGGEGAGEGLCAVDFRAGLVLLPFLPMSPADLRLILEGLAEGSLVQFDRCDFQKLRAFVSEHRAVLGEVDDLVEAIERYDRRYRRSMPDVTHQGLRLLTQKDLRRDVRKGLSEGYLAGDLVDEAFASRLVGTPSLFTGFYLLGAIPLLGGWVRRVVGNAAYRRHMARSLTGVRYFLAASRGRILTCLVEWHRRGRTGEAATRRLADDPLSFWLQRLTLGLLPAKLHRCVAEPRYVLLRLREGFVFVKSFYRDEAFRERWLTELVHEGYRDGMLHEQERDAILARVKEPFIAKYLKCLAVHFATLPVTQVVSVALGGCVAAWMLASGRDWKAASAAFVGIVALFQVIPISPGSLCRGGYVVYLMIRERNFRDYMVAAPLSFLKYIGYLAFPIQMVTSYPELSRFMASRWATGAVHIVPVFGEKGALLEHAVFDLFFNLPRIIGGWARRRIRFVLDAWLFLGMLLLGAGFYGCELHWSEKRGVNLILTVIGVFILPRVLFYPMFRRGRSR